MKILVTGANGYLGSAIATAASHHGHEVYGMARNDVGLRTVAAAGFVPVPGDLDDPGSLSTVVREFDAVIEAVSADHTPSTVAFVEALRGTGRTYIRTSGTGVYSDRAGGAASGVVHVESDGHQPVPALQPRFKLDRLVLEASDGSFRGIVIRPSMVFGRGGSEQLPVMLRGALRTGFSGYVGEGLNIYSNVFVDDLAELYCLALASAQPGSTYNAGSGESTFKTIAASIGKLLGLPARAFEDDDEAAGSWGTWVNGLASNSRVDSGLARLELGWRPQGPALHDDILLGSYRRVWAGTLPTPEQRIKDAR